MTYDPERHQFQAPCKSCGAVRSFNAKEMENFFLGTLEKDSDKLIRTLVLTDCSNAHSAIYSAQPKSHDKSTKILLHYARDFLAF